MATQDFSRKIAEFMDLGETDIAIPLIRPILPFR